MLRTQANPRLSERTGKVPPEGATTCLRARPPTVDKYQREDIGDAIYLFE